LARLAVRAPALVAVKGVGPETAGALLVAAGDNPDRLRSEGAFARLCGVEPLPASERDAIVAVLRALGEPMRLEIYRLIAAQDGPLCVCDIAERFPLQQPTISYHLRVLREAELVTVCREGKWAYYAPNAKGLDILRDAPSQLVPATLAVAR
jgi:ArsR family transcriptional regulator, arsenate/arsenite/antimonite-responsive transcriptional repressor